MSLLRLNNLRPRIEEKGKWDIMKSVKDIYLELLEEDPPQKESPSTETVEQMVKRIRPIIEKEVLRRFENIKRDELRKTVKKIKNDGFKCYPTVEIDFSDPLIWGINLGVMATNEKSIYTFYRLDATPFDAFGIIGYSCKLNKYSLDDLFPFDEKIPFVAEKNVKNVFFMFKA